MYECCSAKRFFRLILLDAIIFALCAAFLFIGKNIVFSAQQNDNEGSVFLPVIIYHSVYRSSPDDYTVTPEQLDNDLCYLAENGYSSVTAQQLVDYTLGKGELPQKPVLITFDDGFYNNLSIALPLLEKYDMSAVVSVVGAYTDKLTHADSHCGSFSYLTWEDINALITSDRVEIGCHTYSMHSLSSADGRKGCAVKNGESNEDYVSAFGNDISVFQNTMHENTGSVSFVFAYPFGFVSEESIPVLRENGFFVTLGCEEKPNYITRDPDCLFGLNRYNRSGFYTTEEFMQYALKE